MRWREGASLQALDVLCASSPETVGRKRYITYGEEVSGVTQGGWTPELTRVFRQDHAATLEWRSLYIRHTYVDASQSQVTGMMSVNLTLSPTPILQPRRLILICN